MADDQGMPGDVRRPRSFARCLELVRETRDALNGLRGVTWQAGGAELGAALKDLGELALQIDAAELAVLADALERGEHTSGQWPLPASEWVSVHSRRYPSGRAASPLVKLAERLGPRNLSPAITDDPDGAHHLGPRTDGDHAAGPAAVDADPTWGDPGLRVGPRTELPECLREGLLTAAVSRPAASTVVAEMTRLAPRLVPDAIPAVWQAYTELAATVGEPSEVRKLRPLLLARHGHPEQNTADENAARARAMLSHGRDGGDGLTDYRLTLDPQAAATLEAALSPLSAPRPGPDGESDTRSAATRRAQALLQLVGRAADIDPLIPGRGSTHTTLILQATDLMAETGYATTVGTIDTGRFLSATTAKAMACTGYVSPVVVDPHGNPILIGRTRRLFTRSQALALMVRDQGCTFPGCTRPAGWTDAHHLVHWADGGPTDLENAALLCRFHHTSVHVRRLAGRVGTGPPGAEPDPQDLEQPQRVIWDLTPGSYDGHLAEWRRAHRRADPGGGIDLPEERPG